jgi:hypothetical protein
MINEFVSWANSNGSAITAIATVALAFFTLIYVDQLKKERSERVMPILVVRKPIGSTDGILCVVVENIGKGHAFDLDFDFSFWSHTCKERKISFKTVKYLFKPQFFKGKTFSFNLFDKDTDFAIPTGVSIEDAKNKFDCLSIKIKYKDELGKKYKKTESLDFKNYSFLSAN